MRLENLLKPELTFCQHPAISKKALLLSISEAFNSCLTSVGKNEIFEGFVSRERLGVTTLGHGIALPHIRCPNIDKPLGALVTLQQAIDFDSQDNEMIDIVFALMVPQETENTHLLILAHLAKLFRQSDFRTQIRNAKNNIDLHDVAIYYEQNESITAATA